MLLAYGLVYAPFRNRFCQLIIDQGILTIHIEHYDKLNHRCGSSLPATLTGMGLMRSKKIPKKRDGERKVDKEAHMYCIADEN